MRHLKDQELDLINITKEELTSHMNHDVDKAWEAVLNLRALCAARDVNSWNKTQVAVWLTLQVRLYRIFKLSNSSKVV